jgi:sulfoxide reductase heme-binding subunit YedZ
MTTIKKLNSSRGFVWLVLAAPFIYLGYGFLREQIYYGEMLHASGELSVRLLMLTLAVTPARLLFPKARWPRWLVTQRRYFGVASFMYAALHTLVYLDKQDLTSIIEDSLGFEMWTGWLALLVFLLLAVTSNDRAVAWLKRRWKALHRLIYIATALTFIHWIFSAFSVIPAIVHLVVIVALESVRLFSPSEKRASRRLQDRVQ